MRQLKDKVDQPLAAILSLNTIAHTVGAAGVGAQAALVYQNISTGVISGLLTLVILIFSEIIPKTLGARYWRQLGFFTAKTLRIMIWLMYPLVLLSNGITRLLGGSAHGMAVSREELSAMADIGHQEGVFAENEMRIIKNLIAFQKVQVRDVMTPRTVVVMANSELSLKEAFANKQLLRFSRIPVYTDNRDNVIGYFHKHELLQQLAEDKHDLKVKELVRSMLIVSDRLSIPVVFERLMEKREHIALAVDEYGGLTGVVTIEDIMETLLGIEIVDEFDSSRDMQEYARQKWQERARLLGIWQPEDSAEKSQSPSKD
ncbi:CNNM domain-containing protein [Cesiribacter andamanensis]|uniref:Hemolysin C n=1 Tax=Cesiribacter andamanensis AMV16 TaxID=1279009 RepID=M7NGB6_9BACT|nr:CNNM domain-containing protein [Cesiribacter andamanensis]EMR00865.1 hypothetical protein ADICEAN_04013 [Cesiribacter andamanensis AMV16]